MHKHTHPHSPPAELPIKAIEAMIEAHYKETHAEHHTHHVGAPTKELAHEKVHSDMNNLRSGFVPPDQMKREIAEIRSTMQQAGGIMPAGFDAKLMALSASNDINLKTAKSLTSGIGSPGLPG